MSEQEKKNKRTAALVSVLVHGLLLVAFLFMLAWKAPNPPLPEYGIELNFGLDNEGTGDIQPEIDASNSESLEEAAPDELPEQTEETEELTEPIEAEPTSEPVVEETTDNSQDSPDVVAKEVVKEEVKPVIEEKPKEEKKEVVKPVEQKEVTKPKEGADGKDGAATQQQAANQGDNIDKVGDKGDEKGTLDARALYGKQGGGGGSALEMTGWVWDFKPKPNDTSNENGRIVFEIKIDDQGEILSVRTLERSVSPAVEKIYRAEVEKLTFSRTSDNSIVAPISTGKITFVIKSK